MLRTIPAVCSVKAIEEKESEARSFFHIHGFEKPGQGFCFQLFIFCAPSVFFAGKSVTWRKGELQTFIILQGSAWLLICNRNRLFAEYLKIQQTGIAPPNRFFILYAQ